MVSFVYTFCLLYIYTSWQIRNILTSQEDAFPGVFTGVAREPRLPQPDVRRGIVRGRDAGWRNALGGHTVARERLFTPLGMDATTFAHQAMDRWQEEFAKGYIVDGDTGELREVSLEVTK